jgi:hypothetical protein
MRDLQAVENLRRAAIKRREVEVVQLFIYSRAICSHEYEFEPVGNFVDTVFDGDTCHPNIPFSKPHVSRVQRMCAVTGGVGPPESN